MSPIAPTLQAFFTDRLTKQRQVSPRTVASYRDSLKLLLGFAQNRTGKAPTYLDWADLDADLVAAFLDHLENERHNSPRTRNLRLTAIRSLFAFAALRHPEHAEVIQRVLAVPAKRFDKQLITFLTAAEIDALVDAPDADRWEGRRDRALLLLTAQTGLRVSELTGLNCDDVVFGDGASVRCLGKGRKHRAVPLTTTAQAVLRVWLAERNGRGNQPLFPTRTKAQHRRGGTPHPRARSHRRTDMSHHSAAAASSPRAASQLRDVVVAGRGRHSRHRPLARSRRPAFDQHLLARRHDHQTTRSRRHHAVVDGTGPLPARRQEARLPRKPLICRLPQPHAHRDRPRHRGFRLTRPQPRHSFGVGIGRRESDQRGRSG
jgi:site-specific recombinase XerD